MRRLMRGGMMLSLASMAWRNRAAIQDKLRSFSGGGASQPTRR